MTQWKVLTQCIKQVPIRRVFPPDVTSSEDIYVLYVQYIRRALYIYNNNYACSRNYIFFGIHCQWKAWMYIFTKKRRYHQRWLGYVRFLVIITLTIILTLCLLQLLIDYLFYIISCRLGWKNVIRRINLLELDEIILNWSWLMQYIYF